MGKRKITITVETHTLLSVRRRKILTRAWCQQCSDFTEFTSLEEAVALTSCDDADLNELIASEKLHTIKTLKESPLVCFLSILRHITKA
ncbi:MAG: hypothetical protein ICV60_13135 [Pyrinomonadaceae bacterium]|nr:hypothetical protein [Pyrinomonadaceae bacterium]